MISYIVASHDLAVLEANLLSTDVLVDGDELIVVENPESIAKAYNEGQGRARNYIKCYVHHDIVITDPDQLRFLLRTTCLSQFGMVGVIGSRTRSLPWWDGDMLGSVTDARMGLLDFGSGGECAYLDGLLLATSQRVTWDESYEGFHLYDHDICEQMLRRGLPNYCLSSGSEMLRHNTTGSTDVTQLPGWAEGVARFRGKWSMAA